MEVCIDISRPLREQFDAMVSVASLTAPRPNQNGKDPIRFQSFPGELEFYYFPAAKFSVPIEMKSVNPPDSEWFIAHVNLGATKQRKSVDGRLLEFHRELPAGLLVYGRGLAIDTALPPNVESEVATVRFSTRFLDDYIDGWRDTRILEKNIIHEELDYRLESHLRGAISAVARRTECHAATLSFIALLFQRLQAHAVCRSHTTLSAQEIAALFRAAAPLRDPLTKRAPSIPDLARTAGMGASKFKIAFKQVFGDAPMQYRHRLRMDFAKAQIRTHGRSPTEVSYLLGYAHPSNFTLAYKKRFGVVPSEDRN